MAKAGRAFLAAFILALLTGGTAEAVGKNLVGASASWTTYDWNASSDKGKAASFDLHNGAPVRVTATEPNDARFVLEIAVEPATVYLFSTRVRTQEVGAANRGAGISVQGIIDGSVDIRGTSGTWRSVDFYGKTSVNQTTVGVTVGIGGYGSLNTGSAWFDDIRVEKVAAAPAGVKVIPLEPVQVAESAPAKSARTGALLVLVVAACGGVLLGAGTILRRPMTRRMPAEAFPSTVAARLAIADVAAMAALTAVTLAISLWNLGGHLAPETGWTAARAGESVTLELPQKTQLSRFYYYSGINERTFDGARFSLSARDDTGRFVPIASWAKEDPGTWEFVEISATTTALRLVADSPGGRINEAAVVAQGSKVPLSGVKIGGSDRSSGGEKLLDEQNAFEYAPSFRTGFYFDEIYHARGAWEMLNHIDPYETTHPPLGKLIIGWGAALFGMNAFGWRIGGALFGVLLVPLMYLFGLKLFRSRFHAFLTASLVAMDFMRFAQSRVAVIDIFGVFFVVLMYYFILDLFPPQDEPTTPARADRALLFAGISFGIGAACKWIALYAAGGLAVLIAVRTVLDVKKRAQDEGSTLRFLFRRFRICCVSFIVIPAFIYVLSYYWFFSIPGPGHDLNDIWALQKHMLNYHRTLVATHEFASPWWSWPLDLRPLWMYVGSGLEKGMTSTIATFGNPAIWWLTIPAVICGTVLAAMRKDLRLAVVLIAFLFQYLPWVGIARLSFIYHFFSAIPFVILLIVALLQAAEEKVPGFRKVEWSYLAVATALFILFYPVLSAQEVSEKYVAALKWLPTWVF